LGLAYKNLKQEETEKCNPIFMFEKSTEKDNSCFVLSVFHDGTGFGNLEMLLRGTDHLP